MHNFAEALAGIQANIGLPSMRIALTFMECFLQSRSMLAIHEHAKDRLEKVGIRPVSYVDTWVFTFLRNTRMFREHWAALREVAPRCWMVEKFPPRKIWEDFFKNLLGTLGLPSSDDLINEVVEDARVAIEHALGRGLLRAASNFLEISGHDPDYDRVRSLLGEECKKLDEVRRESLADFIRLFEPDFDGDFEALFKNQE